MTSCIINNVPGRIPHSYVKAPRNMQPHPNQTIQLKIISQTWQRTMHLHQERTNSTNLECLFLSSTKRHVVHFDHVPCQPSSLTLFFKTSPSQLEIHHCHCQPIQHKGKEVNTHSRPTEIEPYSHLYFKFQVIITFPIRLDYFMHVIFLFSLFFF